MIRLIAVLSVLQCVALAQQTKQSSCPRILGNVNTFAPVYYADDSLADLGKFDMVILDPANYDSADIARLKTMGCLPMAYLNIGEIETYRSYFTVSDTALFISPDPYWRNRYYADICSPMWQKTVLTERIPSLERAGYCGLFLDLSNLLEEYPEMSECAVSLIRKIRMEVGSSDLILDGGIEIANSAGPYINGVAVEGLMGFYNFNSEKYEVRPDSVEDRESTFLLKLAKKFKLKIFQIDYASASDTATRVGIILQSRRIGFVPYVGTIELDTLFTDTIRKLRVPKSVGKNPFAD